MVLLISCDTAVIGGIVKSSQTVIAVVIITIIYRGRQLTLSSVQTKTPHGTKY